MDHSEMIEKKRLPFCRNCEYLLRRYTDGLGVTHDSLHCHLLEIDVAENDRCDACLIHPNLARFNREKKA